MGNVPAAAAESDQNSSNRGEETPEACLDNIRFSRGDKDLSHCRDYLGQQ